LELRTRRICYNWLSGGGREWGGPRFVPEKLTRFRAGYAEPDP
jgi:hypothetical protein